MKTAYYFGYCTWLDPALLNLRVPGATVIGIGTAANHALEFRRSADGAGNKGWCHLSGAGAAWGSVAMGAIVEIEPPAQARRFEANGTRHLTVHGPGGEAFDCWTYDLLDAGEPMRVPDYEWRHIRAGMKHWDLPTEYVAAVEAAYSAAGPCPDSARPDPLSSTNPTNHHVMSVDGE